jgi:hypothetical protein
MRALCALDALLVLAMMFFLFLPISDRRTVTMRLCTLCVIAASLVASVTTTRAPQLQLASVIRDR